MIISTSRITWNGEILGLKRAIAEPIFDDDGKEVVEA